MCKVLIIPKITNETRDAALKFMNVMKPLLSSGNKDGLGYAAVDSQGDLFGERWHKNEDSYSEKLKSMDESPADFLDKVASKAYVRSETGGAHNTFGSVNLSDISALTMHTRMATSGREFKNTHPFVYEDMDTSLIHNGVISNVTDFKFKVSTCDSEAILVSYLDKGVNSDMNALQAMADSLRGYYACGVFSRDASGNRILDVFKGPDASLYGVYIKELDSLVFCTSMNDILLSTKELNFTISKIYELVEGIAFRFVGGELVNNISFKPAPRWNNNEPTTPKVNAPKVKPKLTKDMVNYLHTIPNIQQIIN